MVFGIALAVGLAGVLMTQHLAGKKLREDNRLMREQIAQWDAQPPKGGAQPASTSGSSLQSSATPEADLEKLRREVASMPRPTHELARLKEHNRKLKAATGEPEDPAQEEFNEQTQVRMNHIKQWGLLFIEYARDHADTLPGSFDEAAQAQNSQPMTGFDTNQFEIVYRDPVDTASDPGNTILFREREARRSPTGEWIKVYGFADGSTTTRSESEETAFDVWEKEHTTLPK